MQINKITILVLISLTYTLGLCAQRSNKQVLDSTITLQNNGNGQLLLYKKNFYNYDSVGQDTLRSEYFFSSNSFVLDAKTNYKYDNSGNVTMETRLTWDQSTSSLVNSYRKTWTFNSHNDLDSYKYAYWNDSLTSWIEIYKESFDYDMNQLLMTKTMHNYDEIDNNWVNYQRENYWYNSIQKVDSFLLEVGSQPGGNWFNHSYIIYDYNLANLLVLSQEFRFLTGSISPTDRDTFIYNTNDFLVEHKHLTFHSGTNMWSIFSTDSLYYDTSENLISEMEFRKSNNGLIPQRKLTYTYDSSVYYSELIIPHDYQETANKQIENTFQWWNQSLSIWDTVYLTNLHYSDIINSMNSVVQPSTLIYPNPAQNEIFVSDVVIATPYTIYDLKGSIRLKGKLNSKSRINLASVESGVYLLMVGNECHKLMVSKP